MPKLTPKRTEVVYSEDVNGMCVGETNALLDTLKLSDAPLELHTEPIKFESLSLVKVGTGNSRRFSREVSVGDGNGIGWQNEWQGLVGKVVWQIRRRAVASVRLPHFTFQIIWG